MSLMQFSLQNKNKFLMYNRALLNQKKCSIRFIKVYGTNNINLHQSSCLPEYLS